MSKQLILVLAVAALAILILGFALGRESKHCNIVQKVVRVDTTISYTDLLGGNGSPITAVTKPTSVRVEGIKSTTLKPRVKTVYDTVTSYIVSYDTVRIDSIVITRIDTSTCDGAIGASTTVSGQVPTQTITKTITNTVASQQPFVSIYGGLMMQADNNVKALNLTPAIALQLQQKAIGVYSYNIAQSRHQFGVLIRIKK
jgi:hypothetical protein